MLKRIECFLVSALLLVLCGCSVKKEIRRIESRLDITEEIIDSRLNLSEDQLSLSKREIVQLEEDMTDLQIEFYTFVNKAVEENWGSWENMTGQVAESFRTYVVEEGDTLWKIADIVYGNSFLWKEIFMFNKIIADPDLIYPGQFLKIPYE
jgi:hypothetical protein